MSTESIEVTGVVPAQPNDVYQGFLSSEIHSAMTGGAAEIESTETGGSFKAWGGYIQGSHIALESGKRIVQHWRTLDFADTDQDSRLEILLKPVEAGTHVTIQHSNIPEGQGKNYETGWQERYLTPMQTYFSQQSK
ncbi:MAG: hypothetical protein EP343_25430 [Deltaproteobacteria bacterium]|nr:MAG: hypothetical protein EP343_25430 [Deltaproteobacteria bacterium]